MTCLQLCQVFVFKASWKTLSEVIIWSCSQVDYKIYAHGNRILLYMVVL